MASPKVAKGDAKARLVPRPRVSTVRIKNFKSIRDVTLELGALNVFVGANGSGKTALLEAIGVLGAAATGAVNDVSLLDRGVRPGPSGRMTSNLSGRRVASVNLGATSAADERYDVTLKGPADVATSPWRFIGERSSVNGVPWVVRGAHSGTMGKSRIPVRGMPSTRGYGLKGASTFEEYGDLVAFGSALSRFVIYDPQTPVLRGAAADRAADPVGLQGGQLAEAAKALLRRSDRFGPLARARLFELIDWASDVGVAEPTSELFSRSVPAAREVIVFRDRYMRGGSDAYVSAYHASEGALYVVFALTVLFHPRAPRFFAIESLDHGLHPRLARTLISLLADHVVRAKRQILLTTHNPLSLDGLPLVNDEVRLFAVNRDVSGHTHVHRVEYSDALAKAEAKGATLSELWTSGMLGGVPSWI